MSILLLTCLTLSLVASGSSEQQHRPSLDPITERPATNKRTDPANKEDWHENHIPDDQTKHPDIDTRITLSEPYKSIIQTTTRFALSQSRITKHLNIDTAMNLLNEVARFLSKPIVLLKTLKVAAVTLATILVTLFLFPGASRFADAAWQDPVNAFNLDRYLTNGLQERSILEALGSRTDETLSRVGLQDGSCRQRSLCYLGEIAKCSFPHTADTITKFVSENFAESNIKDNIYARAFISGFVDRNCTGIGTGTNNPREQHNCLGTFISSILSGVDQARK